MTAPPVETRGEKKLTCAASSPGDPSPAKGSDAGGDGEGSRNAPPAAPLPEAVETALHEYVKACAEFDALTGWPGCSMEEAATASAAVRVAHAGLESAWNAAIAAALRPQSEERRALENVRMFVARCIVASDVRAALLRFCAEGGVTGSVLRETGSPPLRCRCGHPHPWMSGGKPDAVCSRWGPGGDEGGHPDDCPCTSFEPTQPFEDPAPPPRIEERSTWMQGGAFCDCGMVEFMVPGPACARTHDPSAGPPTQHRPDRCRLAERAELANLAPSAAVCEEKGCTTCCYCGREFARASPPPSASEGAAALCPECETERVSGCLNIPAVHHTGRCTKWAKDLGRQAIENTAALVKREREEQRDQTPLPRLDAASEGAARDASELVPCPDCEAGEARATCDQDTTCGGTGYVMGATTGIFDADSDPSCVMGREHASPTSLSTCPSCRIAALRARVGELEGVLTVLAKVADEVYIRLERDWYWTHPLFAAAEAARAALRGGKGE